MGYEWSDRCRWRGGGDGKTHVAKVRVKAFLTMFLIGIAGVFPFANVHCDEEIRSSYEAMLDDSSRAREKGVEFFTPIKESRYSELQHHFDRDSFDRWMETMSKIKKGMSTDQVTSLLGITETPTLVGFGSGITATFVLDDAYFVTGLFGYEDGLKEFSKHPVSRGYFVVRDDLDFFQEYEKLMRARYGR